MRLVISLVDTMQYKPKVATKSTSPSILVPKIVLEKSKISPFLTLIKDQDGDFNARRNVLYCCSGNKNVLEPIHDNFKAF